MSEVSFEFVIFDELPGWFKLLEIIIVILFEFIRDYEQKSGIKVYTVNGGGKSDFSDSFVIHNRQLIQGHIQIKEWIFRNGE